MKKIIYLTLIVVCCTKISYGQEKKDSVVEKDYDREFKSVEREASFPGGLDGWRDFLEKNLNSSVPVNNGAPAGRYSVDIQFWVDKKGNVSEVKALTDPGYGTAQEAVRVMKLSPAWIPAEQNKRTVFYRQRQRITFVLEEEKKK